MSGALPAFVEPLGAGVFAVDTGFHRARFDAAYLVVDSGRAAFVDTGTHHAVPRLLAALEALGLPSSAVDWVIPTHVHLDHAGGVGALMQRLPQARVLVHPRGLRHLVDPSALYAGALAVYGPDEMARSYGTLVPVDAARATPSADGMRLAFGARTFEFIDTPGHARHHHCIWDSASRGWFTGDTFGLAYPELSTDRGPWMVPASTPVQFDPEALRGSIGRLLDAAPALMYLTHYGAVGREVGVPALAERLLALLDGMVEVARRAGPADAGRHRRLQESLHALYRRSLQAHGCTLGDAEVGALLAIDLELNAQGLAIWLDRA